MIYILVILWSHCTAGIEFNTKEQCQAASKEIRSELGYRPEAMFCVAKGEKK